MMRLMSYIFLNKLDECYDYEDDADNDDDGNDQRQFSV